MEEAVPRGGGKQTGWGRNAGQAEICQNADNFSFLKTRQGTPQLPGVSS